jgi:hypothetical protein
MISGYQMDIRFTNHQLDFVLAAPFPKRQRVLTHQKSTITNQ